MSPGGLKEVEKYSSVHRNRCYRCPSGHSLKQTSVSVDHLKQTFFVLFYFNLHSSFHRFSCLKEINEWIEMRDTFLSILDRCCGHDSGKKSYNFIRTRSHEHRVTRYFRLDYMGTLENTPWFSLFTSCYLTTKGYVDPISV